MGTLADIMSVIINKRTKVYHDSELASETCGLDSVDDTLLTRQEERPESNFSGENRMKMCTYCCGRSGQHGAERTEDGRCTICFGVVREKKEAPAPDPDAPAPRRGRRKKEETAEPEVSDSDEENGEGEAPAET